MNRNEQQTARDLTVFALLVAIGVAGRWGQPNWEFTPIAATAIFASCYFSRRTVAALVPLATLAISDLTLPAHNNLGVMIATYVAMASTVLFGRLLRKKSVGWQAAWRWAVCCLAPASLFFVVTNFAVWLFGSEVVYPKTVAGLVQCYESAVLFYRWMLAGDLFYMAVLFGCWALAGESALRAQRAEQRLR